jgi:outer membrane lipoprotein carrier protein
MTTPRRRPLRTPLAPARAPARLVLSLALLWGGVQPADASAQDASAILARASALYEGLEGFCSDFRQEIQVTLLRQTTRGTGELCQARSDRFEMRFIEPAGDRIVADGADLWVYFPSTDAGQVFRSRLAASDGRFDLHREFLSDPGRRYGAELLGREAVDGRESHLLALQPLIPSPYVRARVWIDVESFLIRKLEILEESESVRTLEFLNIRLNPSIAPDRFRFLPGEGVQVIQR